jgi:hypothetical protein
LIVPVAAPLAETVQLPDTVTVVDVTAVTSELGWAVVLVIEVPLTFTDFNVTVSPTK